jgi:demethylmenaquinone methyltransferase/2-methoxy-6-polyprenyl-1,4-benzoquinol methylase
VAGKYYVEGEARAERVNDLFAAVAPRYDVINDLQSFGLHRWWKRRLIQLAAIQPGEPALDVCCGTGDVALALARAGAEVTGIDFSEPMLAVARRRSAESGTDKVQFLQGDALRLPFPDASFAVVTISYGLRNLADFQAGLAELDRVLRPGGRLLVLDFGKPDWAVWRALYFQYLRWAGPCLDGSFAVMPTPMATFSTRCRSFPLNAAWMPPCGGWATRRRASSICWAV